MLFIVLILSILVILIYLLKPNLSTFGGNQKSSMVKELYFSKFSKRFITNSNKGSIPEVDMVYVITMPQRKGYVTKQINKMDLNCKYFDAVKPSDLTTSDYDKLSTINQPKSDIFKKYTRLPVLLSFIMCFIDSLQNGYKNIIVFEDDIKIDASMTTIKEGIQEFIHSNCDIFFMGYCYLNCNQMMNLHKYKNIIEAYDRNILCCHSLCIKTQMLPGLIDFCFPMTQNSDELFRNYFMLNNIKVCVPRKVYFIQNRDTVESLNESYDDELKTCKF